MGKPVQQDIRTATPTVNRLPVGWLWTVSEESRTITRLSTYPAAFGWCFTKTRALQRAAAETARRIESESALPGVLYIAGFTDPGES